MHLTPSQKNKVFTEGWTILKLHIGGMLKIELPQKWKLTKFIIFDNIR